MPHRARTSIARWIQAKTVTPEVHFRDLLETGQLPSVRRIRRELRMGQPKAQEEEEEEARPAWLVWALIALPIAGIARLSRHDDLARTMIRSLQWNISDWFR